MPAAGANRGYAKTVLPGASRNPSIAQQHPAVSIQAPSAPPIINTPASRSAPSRSFSNSPPSHGSFSQAGIPQVPRAPQQSPGVRLAQVLAATRTANPWTGSKSAVTGQILSTWLALRAKGLLPGTAVPPKIVFDTHETPGVGAYVVKGLGARNSELHVPPTFAKALTHPTDISFANWARDTIIHELAHTGQNAAAYGSKQMVEGGAQTFAQIAAPQVFKNTYVPRSQGAYGRYVNQVQSREPNQWVMHGQFQPGAQPPAVNMPGGQAFRSAMGGVGEAAGAAAQEAATRSNYLAQPRRFPIGQGGELLRAIGSMPGYAAIGAGYAATGKIRRSR